MKRFECRAELISAQLPPAVGVSRLRRLVGATMLLVRALLLVTAPLAISAAVLRVGVVRSAIAVTKSYDANALELAIERIRLQHELKLDIECARCLPLMGARATRYCCSAGCTHACSSRVRNRSQSARRSTSSSM